MTEEVKTAEVTQEQVRAVMAALGHRTSAKKKISSARNAAKAVAVRWGRMTKDGRPSSLWKKLAKEREQARKARKSVRKHWNKTGKVEKDCVDDQRVTATAEEKSCLADRDQA